MNFDLNIEKTCPPSERGFVTDTITVVLVFISCCASHCKAERRENGPKHNTF